MTIKAVNIKAIIEDKTWIYKLQIKLRIIAFDIVVNEKSKKEEWRFWGGFAYIYH